VKPRTVHHHTRESSLPRTPLSVTRSASSPHTQPIAFPICKDQQAVVTQEEAIQLVIATVRKNDPERADNPPEASRFLAPGFTHKPLSSVRFLTIKSPPTVATDNPLQTYSPRSPDRCACLAG